MLYTLAVCESHVEVIGLWVVFKANLKYLGLMNYFVDEILFSMSVHQID